MKKPPIEIIEKTIANTATVAEGKQALRWFATKEGQDFLARRMDHDMNRITLGEEHTYVDHPIPSKEIYHSLMKRVQRRRILNVGFKIAAILIPFIFLSVLYFEVDQQIDLFSEVEYDEVSVPKGEQLQILFQDGSRAYLNAGSKIRYPRKFVYKERRVELQGEAWFNVAKNGKRPFVVDLGELGVYVVGTTFNVKAYPEEEDISISLESGRVEIDGAKMSRRLNLSPGEQALYNRSTGKCTVLKLNNISESSSWRDQRIVFSNTSLQEVITLLSRMYNVNFQIDDDKVYNYSFTIKLNNSSLSATLEELELISPVRFDEQKDKIIVRMKK